MEISRLLEYWLQSSKYDLGTADSLFNAKKYPYALFFGHLAIEKLLKAIYVKRTKRQAPYSHNLLQLAQKTKIDFSEEMLNLLADFMEFYIEARYPDIKRQFYKKCNLQYTKDNLERIRKVYRWLVSESKGS